MLSYTLYCRHGKFCFRTAPDFEESIRIKFSEL